MLGISAGSGGENMGPIWRYRMAMVAWPIGGILISLFFHNGPIAIGIAFGLMIVLAVYSMSIRCPHCGKKVGLNDGGWDAFAPAKCGECGFNLKHN